MRFTKWELKAIEDFRDRYELTEDEATALLGTRRHTDDEICAHIGCDRAELRVLLHNAECKMCNTQWPADAVIFSSP